MIDINITDVNNEEIALKKKYMRKIIQCSLRITSAMFNNPLSLIRRNCTHTLISVILQKEITLHDYIYHHSFSKKKKKTTTTATFMVIMIGLRKKNVLTYSFLRPITFLKGISLQKSN